MNTEFHGYINGSEVTFVIKAARWFEGKSIPVAELDDMGKLEAHNKIMAELEDMCHRWLSKTGEDYFPISRGLSYHEYDLVEKSQVTTRRKIWKFEQGM